MDPNANLSEQLAIARELLDEESISGFQESIEQGHRLAELVLALDEWLTKGGFPPKRWNITD